MATDRIQQAKDIASSALSELSASVGTHRQVRGLQKNITDLVGERDRVMLEIGRKVFALYGRGKVRNADIIPLCERIEEMTAAVGGLNEQIQELSKPKPKGDMESAEVKDETELEEEESASDETSEDAADESETAEEESASDETSEDAADESETAEEESE